MTRMDKASTLLTAALLMITGTPLEAAANRCEADLGRIETSFCLNQSSQQAGLQHQWQLNDDLFTLSSRACFLDGGAAGARRDLIIAIDRSQNVWLADTARGKFAAGNIEAASHVISKLQHEAKQDPALATKVGLVLFSSAPDCREWTGGYIAVDREFPCLYVPAGSVADQAHVDQLQGFLKAAERKYSQTTSRASEYGIVADLLASHSMNLEGEPGLLLLSDGRSYIGEEGDPFVYLRTANYARAQEEALAKFSDGRISRYKFVFGLNPTADPAFDIYHQRAYENMCATPNADPADCDKTQINLTSPATWPVNRLDIRQFAEKLAVSTNAAPTPVVPVTTKQDIETALEALRFDGVIVPVEAVSFSVNGAAPLAGVVEGDRIRIENLPADQGMALELFVKSRGVEYRIPMNVATNKIPYDGQPFQDREMFCEAGPAAVTLGPGATKLQGGSASCGVIAGADNEGNVSWLLLLALWPLALAFFRPNLGRAILCAGMLLIPAMASTDAMAADKNDSKGVNALQYRPVVDGIGTAEKATPLAFGKFNGGLFLDYANDVIELGGEKNKRIESVMDDLVTVHAVANVGIYDNVSLGVHIPYVHKSDVARELPTDKIKGGSLGQPADMAAFFKFGLMHRSRFDLGVMPIVTIPTGNAALLLGDGAPAYGALFLLSGGYQSLTWAYNLGYMHRSEPSLLADARAQELEVQGQILNYAGLEYRWSPTWSLGGGLQAKFSSEEDIDFGNTNPAEWSAALKMRPLAGFEVQAGFGTGIGKGFGSPDYRAHVGLSYIPESRSGRAYAPGVARRGR